MDSGGRVVEEVLVVAEFLVVAEVSVGGAAGGEVALFAAGSPREGESLLSTREDIFFFSGVLFNELGHGAQFKESFSFFHQKRLEADNQTRLIFYNKRVVTLTTDHASQSWQGKEGKEGKQGKEKEG